VARLKIDPRVLPPEIPKPNTTPHPEAFPPEVPDEEKAVEFPEKG
jgi:hypothetical protein